MCIDKRKLSYALAINEGITQCMDADESVLLIGQGVKSPWYVGQTCKDLIKKFGEERVIDTPVSENAMTGAAVGAALNGMKSIVIHPRVDFLLYGLDPIINQAANWHYMFGGRASVPTVIWPVINRKGEQGAQHSQALHALFAHIPGLKVVMPSDAYSAKGLMVAAINDPNPVIYMDDRSLYGTEANVPKSLYELEIGKAKIARKGKDLTVVTLSAMVKETKKAADILAERGIYIEIIDLLSIKPYDKDIIKQSVSKTGKLLVVDCGWKSFGVSAEISAFVAEKCFNHLTQSVERLALPDCPAPACHTLEEEYYFDNKTIIEKIEKIFEV